MKQTILILVIILLIISVITVIPNVISAQPSFPDNPEQIPVDGGLALLTAAGAGYAIKKFSKKRQDNDSL